MPKTEFKKTTPRVEAKPMQGDPKLSIAVGEKGGVSIYGLGRFPLTLYLGQWERLIGVVPEIVAYMEEHVDVLDTGEAKETEPVQDRTFTLGPAEIALASAEANRLIEAGDMANAVKYATIKEMGNSRLKVSFDQLALVQALKARK